MIGEIVRHWIIVTNDCQCTRVYQVFLKLLVQCRTHVSDEEARHHF